MNYNDAKYVLAIAKYNSFSKAAEQLYVAQPSLSRHISNLEKQLGVTLFERKPGLVKLTPAGERYAAYANEYLALQTRIDEEFTRLAENARHTIRFGIPTQISYTILPRLLCSFQQTMPKLVIESVNGTTRELSDQLSRGEIDATILAAPIQEPGYDCLLVGEDHILLAAPPQHALFRSVDINQYTPPNFFPLRLQEIANERFLITEQFMQSTIQQLLNKEGITLCHLMRVPSLSVAWDLAGAGVGFSFIMQQMLREKSPQQQPVYCSILSPFAKMAFYLTYHQIQRSHNPLLDKFIRQTEEVLNNYFAKG